MIRIGLAALLLAVFAACGDGGGSTPEATSPTANEPTSAPVTPGEQPLGIPRTAEAVVETVTLGAITRGAGQEPQGEDTRELLDATCGDGQITFTTTEETIYATRDCDGFWDDAAMGLFLHKQVAIVLEVTPARQRVLFKTLDGAQSEFTVEGIWLN